MAAPLAPEYGLPKMCSRRRLSILTVVFLIIAVAIYVSTRDSEPASENSTNDSVDVNQVNKYKGEGNNQSTVIDKYPIRVPVDGEEEGNKLERNQVPYAPYEIETKIIVGYNRTYRTNFTRKPKTSESTTHRSEGR